MDHKEAVQLQAAVKYVLGELPPSERDSFEEHYFDCGECALDVKAAVGFVETSRQVLRVEGDRAARPAESKEGWLTWFRPIVAAPAFAVLLLALGYQSLVSLPHWKSVATRATAPRFLPMNSLISANTRGSDSLTFKVRPHEEFGVYVDVPADVAYRVYLVRLIDPTVHSEVLPPLSYEEAQKTKVVKVNPGERSGSYQLLVSGLPSPESDPEKATILATMKFTVEFIK